MKLIQLVNAYITADAMSSEAWPYDLALALVKVKKQTREEAAFFIERERALVDRYAATDENGNIRLTPAGTFLFKAPAEASEYERARRELGDTEAGIEPAPVRVKAPAEIKPSYIEALEGFVEFS